MSLKDRVVRGLIKRLVHGGVPPELALAIANASYPGWSGDPAMPQARVDPGRASGVIDEGLRRRADVDAFTFPLFGSSGADLADTVYGPGTAVRLGLRRKPFVPGPKFWGSVAQLVTATYDGWAPELVEHDSWGWMLYLATFDGGEGVAADDDLDSSVDDEWTALFVQDGVLHRVDGSEATGPRPPVSMGVQVLGEDAAPVVAGVLCDFVMDQYAAEVASSRSPRSPASRAMWKVRGWVPD